MPKFRMKPKVIEAVQWKGTNVDEVYGFAEKYVEVPYLSVQDGHLHIEGPYVYVSAEVNDWIVRGYPDLLYKISSDMFESMYDPIESEDE